MLAMCGVAILLTDDREMLILVMVHRNEYRKVVSSSSSVIVRPILTTNLFFPCLSPKGMPAQEKENSRKARLTAFSLFLHTCTYLHDNWESISYINWESMTNNVIRQHKKYHETMTSAPGEA
jgi:hypothetical protein